MSSVTRSLSVSSLPVRLACLAMVASLSGCGMLESVLSTDKVDYRGAARQTSGLDVPPDLTQLARDQRAQVKGGVVSASALAQGGTVAAPVAAAGNAVAVNAVADLRIERTGATRWLHSSLPPEQVWPQLRAFWQDRGFELVKDQSDVGVMETNWNENRAKLPQDFIRQTIGKVFDSMYSTGERDMFRTRVERGTSGGTDIYIVHRGMIEVYTNQSRDATAWQPRPQDPQLEAEMLSRLMLKLGAKPEQANAALAQDTSISSTTAQKLAQASTGAKTRPLSEVPDAIQVNEGFDRAWRRVGQSLDRHGFTIEDRDRPQGLFFLRYADPNQAGKEEPNFFQRLFGNKETTAAARYRVSVKSQGDKSTVTVLDDKGQQQTNEIAKRILNLLMDDLR
jgi:outer membrane protein assembly factor BamC